MSTLTTHENSLLTESFIFAGRRYARWRRDPMIPLQAVLFPTLLLVTYKLLLGKSIMRITGTDSVYGLVPMCAIAGAMFGALAIGLAMTAERNTGVLTRFWTLPVHRASAMIGTLIAEGGRTLGGAALITVIGVALGLRFERGVLMAIPFVLVPVAVVSVFTMMVIALSIRAENNVMLTWLGTGSIGLVFCSSGMAPVGMYPSWLQSFIAFQPISPAIETMRGLAGHGPVLWPLLLTCAWLIGLAAIFGPLAVRGYRAVAEAG
ncbi:ABC transporter permease [Mycolicibacterium litorale]|uniref:ABC transporter permease n=1 Tax=Mycolicibacterium litorale TaxID=758802 RepID=UPI003CFAB0C8